MMMPASDARGIATTRSASSTSIGWPNVRGVTKAIFTSTDDNDTNATTLFAPGKLLSASPAFTATQLTDVLMSVGDEGRAATRSTATSDSNATTMSVKSNTKRRTASDAVVNETQKSKKRRNEIEIHGLKWGVRELAEAEAKKAESLSKPRKERTDDEHRLCQKHQYRVKTLTRNIKEARRNGMVEEDEDIVVPEITGTEHESFSSKRANYDGFNMEDFICCQVDSLITDARKDAIAELHLIRKERDSLGPWTS